MNSLGADVTLKTGTHSDGGADPQWNEAVEFDVIDQYEVKVECLDKDLIGSDLIGSGELNLQELFLAAFENSKAGGASASLDTWLNLTYDHGGKRGVQPAGDVHLSVFFVGAENTRYPLYMPTITGGGGGEGAGEVLNVKPVASVGEVSDSFFFLRNKDKPQNNTN